MYILLIPWGNSSLKPWAAVCRDATCAQGSLSCSGESNPDLPIMGPVYCLLMFEFLLFTREAFVTCKI